MKRFGMSKSRKNDPGKESGIEMSKLEMSHSADELRLIDLFKMQRSAPEALRHCSLEEMPYQLQMFKENNRKIAEIINKSEQSNERLKNRDGLKHELQKLVDTAVGFEFILSNIKSAEQRNKSILDSTGPEGMDLVQYENLRQMTGLLSDFVDPKNKDKVMVLAYQNSTEDIVQYIHRDAFLNLNILDIAGMIGKTLRFLRGSGSFVRVYIVPSDQIKNFKELPASDLPLLSNSLSLVRIDDFRDWLKAKLTQQSTLENKQNSQEPALLTEELIDEKKEAIPSAILSVHEKEDEKDEVIETKSDEETEVIKATSPAVAPVAQEQEKANPTIIPDYQKNKKNIHSQITPRESTFDKKKKSIPQVTEVTPHKNNNLTKKGTNKSSKHLEETKRDIRQTVTNIEKLLEKLSRVEQGIRDMLEQYTEQGIALEKHHATQKDDFLEKCKAQRESLSNMLKTCNQELKSNHPVFSSRDGQEQLRLANKVITPINTFFGALEASYKKALEKKVAEEYKAVSDEITDDLVKDILSSLAEEQLNSARDAQELAHSLFSSPLIQKLKTRLQQFGWMQASVNDYNALERMLLKLAQGGVLTIAYENEFGEKSLISMSDLKRINETLIGIVSDRPKKLVIDVLSREQAAALFAFQENFSSIPFDPFKALNVFRNSVQNLHPAQAQHAADLILKRSLSGDESETLQTAIHARKNSEDLVVVEERLKEMLRVLDLVGRLISLPEPEEKVELLENEEKLVLKQPVAEQLQVLPSDKKGRGRNMKIDNDLKKSAEDMKVMIKNIENLLQRRAELDLQETYDLPRALNACREMHDQIISSKSEHKAQIIKDTNQLIKDVGELIEQANRDISKIERQNHALNKKEMPVKGSADEQLLEKIREDLVTFESFKASPGELKEAKKQCKLFQAKIKSWQKKLNQCSDSTRAYAESEIQRIESFLKFVLEGLDKKMPAAQLELPANHMEVKDTASKESTQQEAAFKVLDAKFFEAESALKNSSSRDYAIAVREGLTDEHKKVFFDLSDTANEGFLKRLSALNEHIDKMLVDDAGLKLKMGTVQKTLKPDLLGEVKALSEKVKQFSLSYLNGTVKDKGAREQHGVFQQKITGLQKELTEYSAMIQANAEEIISSIQSDLKTVEEKLRNPLKAGARGSVFDREPKLERQSYDNFAGKMRSQEASKVVKKDHHVNRVEILENQFKDFATSLASLTQEQALSGLEKLNQAVKGWFSSLDHDPKKENFVQQKYERFLTQLTSWKRDINEKLSPASDRDELMRRAETLDETTKELYNAYRENSVSLESAKEKYATFQAEVNELNHLVEKLPEQYAVRSKLAIKDMVEKAAKRLENISGLLQKAELDLIKHLNSRFTENEQAVFGLTKESAESITKAEDFVIDGGYESNDDRPSELKKDTSAESITKAEDFVIDGGYESNDDRPSELKKDTSAESITKAEDFVIDGGYESNDDRPSELKKDTSAESITKAEDFVIDGGYESNDDRPLKVNTPEQKVTNKSAVPGLTSRPTAIEEKSAPRKEGSHVPVEPRIDAKPHPRTSVDASDNILSAESGSKQAANAGVAQAEPLKHTSSNNLDEKRSSKKNVRFTLPSSKESEFDALRKKCDEFLTSIQEIQDGLEQDELKDNESSVAALKELHLALSVALANLEDNPEKNFPEFYRICKMAIQATENKLKNEGPVWNLVRPILNGFLQVLNALRHLFKLDSKHDYRLFKSPALQKLDESVHVRNFKDKLESDKEKYDLDTKPTSPKK
jgi:hypothetical protein